MDISGLFAEMKLHGRIDGDIEDANLVLMLDAAAGDVASRAGYTLPADLADLPKDMRFAIIDQAVAIYDDRGDSDTMRGLTVAASRIVARYRGVSLGAADTTDGGEVV